MTEETPQQTLARLLLEKEALDNGFSCSRQSTQSDFLSALSLAESLAAEIERLAGENERLRVITNHIQEIMQTYREQEQRGYVDTPGGLEHMGDVWRLFGKWDKALRATDGEGGGDAPLATLSELVACKRLKDAGGGEGYERRKEAAWKRAFELVGDSDA